MVVSYKSLIVSAIMDMNIVVFPVFNFKSVLLVTFVVESIRHSLSAACCNYLRYDSFN